MPETLRQLDRRIGEIRTEKEAAIDAQDFERAVTLRDEERDLLARRDAEQRRWLAAAEQRQLQTAARQRQSASAASAELDRLRRVVHDLRAQLRRHGIDPEAEPPARPRGDRQPPALSLGQPSASVCPQPRTALSLGQHRAGGYRRAARASRSR